MGGVSRIKGRSVEVRWMVRGKGERENESRTVDGEGMLEKGEWRKEKRKERRRERGEWRKRRKRKEEKEGWVRVWVCGYGEDVI
jgi:hypothetical protein